MRFFKQRVADFLKARPGVWIPAIEFEAIGGRQGWRTRISDCRRSGMCIENRLRKVGTVTYSEYRFWPDRLPLEHRA